MLDTSFKKLIRQFFGILLFTKILMHVNEEFIFLFYVNILLLKSNIVIILLTIIVIILKFMIDFNFMANF